MIDDKNGNACLHALHAAFPDRALPSFRKLDRDTHLHRPGRLMCLTRKAPAKLTLVVPLLVQWVKLNANLDLNLIACLNLTTSNNHLSWRSMPLTGLLNLQTPWLLVLFQGTVPVPVRHRTP